MRDLEPPVAVGILGGWGSGKSYIMHLMQKRMTEIRSQPIDEKKAWGSLAESSKGNNEIQHSPYVGHIYQIKFDAWTYARSNLWASLMETVFFELNRQLTLEKQLEKVGIDSLKGGKIWQALNDMSDEERQTLLECELDRNKLEDWEEIVDQQQIEDLLLENLKKTNQKKIELLSNKESELREKKIRLQQETERIKLEVLTELNETLAPPILSPSSEILRKALGHSLNELQKEVAAIVPSNRKLNQSDLEQIQSVFEYFRSNKLLTWSGFKKWISANWKLAFGFSIFALLSLLIPIFLLPFVEKNILKVILILVPFVPTLATGLSLFKKFLGWYKSIEMSFRAYQKQVVDRQIEIAQVHGKRLKEKLIHSDNVIKIEANIKQLEAQIQQQREAINVVNHASLAEFVSSQLEKGQYKEQLGLLQQVKNDLATLTEKLTLPKQRGKRYEEKVRLLKNLFPRGPARVILYIDDLDRCPPDRVVEVLEAIQLLVKTRLFVVILAIDERYIARALEKVYAGILCRNGKPSGMDYIEKIIQIPYRVRTIAPSALETYLTAQMQVDIESENPIDSVNSSISSSLFPVDPSFISVRAPNSLSGTTVQTGSDKQDSKIDSFEDLPPQILKFSKEEFNTVLACCQHVDLSPRTLKRLINVYKLFKIIWFRSNRLRNMQHSEKIKQAIVAFLALAGRYPNLMRSVFDNLEIQYEESRGLDKTIIDSFPEKDSFGEDTYLSREWNRLRNDVEALQLSDIRLDQLGAETFSMVRSFCFVGDIGYDPEDFVSSKVSYQPKISTLKSNLLDLIDSDPGTSVTNQSLLQNLKAE
jgi:predicted KAP-like P-loop ATPase